VLAVLLETLARHVRLGALAVAIAVVGAGGATAAMVTEPVVVPSVVAPEAAVFDQDACDDARNHGAYVSFVAKSTQGLADRGALVSAAAQSDCGKRANGSAVEKPAAKAAKQDAKATQKAAKVAAKAERLAKVKSAKVAKTKGKAARG